MWLTRGDPSIYNDRVPPLGAMCIWREMARTARSTKIEIISIDSCGQLHRLLAQACRDGI